MGTHHQEYGSHQDISQQVHWKRVGSPKAGQDGSRESSVAQKIRRILKTLQGWQPKAVEFIRKVTRTRARSDGQEEEEDIRSLLTALLLDTVTATPLTYDDEEETDSESKD